MKLILVVHDQVLKFLSGKHEMRDTLFSAILSKLVISLLSIEDKISILKSCVQIEKLQVCTLLKL